MVREFTERMLHYRSVCAVAHIASERKQQPITLLTVAQAAQKVKSLSEWIHAYPVDTQDTTCSGYGSSRADESSPA